MLIGVARLSRNVLVRSSATLYVETLRNIPPYLLVFASFFVVVQQSLPPIQDAWKTLSFCIASGVVEHLVNGDHAPTPPTSPA